MDLLQLRYFQAVAQREHVSQAADELGIPQPSLSRTIARLESELGVPLFDRQGRRIRLNRFGEAFLRRVDAALSELNDGRTELADAAGLARGSVTIAAESMHDITDMLAAFHSEYPGVQLRLTQCATQDMATQLHSGEVDVCFASQPVAGSSLEVTELFSEEVLLAVPPTHPLARRTSVSIHSLVDEPFVTTPPAYWPRVLLERLFAGSGAGPLVACESNEPGAMRRQIGAGLGIGLLPAMSRRITSKPPVAWLRVDHLDCRRSLALIRRTDAYESVAARQFRDAVVQGVRQVDLGA